MDPIRARATALATGLATGIALGAAIAAEAADLEAGSGEPGAAAEQTVRALHFDVFLDERPIGFQRFELAKSADGLVVETRARFELTLLRIKALDYDHENRERWRSGCLQSIESRTRQNGKDYRVTGRAGAEGFTVEGEEGRQRLAACVGTFSYWDKRQLLRQSRLLNSQTGEYLAVTTKPLGRGSLRLGDRELAVDRFMIEGEDLEITLAYTRESNGRDESEWVALDSPLFAGRTLRYRRRVGDLDSFVAQKPAPVSDPRAQPTPAKGVPRSSNP